MFTQDRAIVHFSENVEVFSRSSLALVAAATVVFVAASAREADLGPVSDELKRIVESKGLSVASVFRYVGLAKQLAGEIEDPVLGALKAARSPGIAHRELAAWFGTLGVTSLDKLSAHLGLYQQTRVPRAAAAPGAPLNAEDRVAAKPHDAEVVEAVAEAADPLVLCREIALAITDRELLFRMGDVFYDRAEALATPERRTRRSRKVAAEVPVAVVAQ